DVAGFALPLALKDVRLALAEAESAAVPMPSVSVVRDRMITGIARGYGELDWTALGVIAAEEAGAPISQSAAPLARARPLQQGGGAVPQDRGKAGQLAK